MLIDTHHLLTIGKAAKRLPVSQPTLRNVLGRHQFPCLRIDGRLFVLESDLRERFRDEYRFPSK